MSLASETVSSLLLRFSSIFVAKATKKNYIIKIKKNTEYWWMPLGSCFNNMNFMLSYPSISGKEIYCNLFLFDITTAIITNTACLS